MTYDWYASYRVESEEAADELVAGAGPYRDVQDLYARLQLLAAAQFFNREMDEERGHYRELVHAAPTSRFTREHIAKETARLGRLGLRWPHLGPDVIQLLPSGSFSLQFQFCLEEPFLSRDDTPFYSHDNPVRKEWVCKVPLLAGSGWKGSLRSAVRWLGFGGTDDMNLLFGPPRPEDGAPDSCLHAGRLLFYPAYFDRIGLEVVNPHTRKWGGGGGPVNLECVPQGAHAVFSLLYVPFDRAGSPWAGYGAEVARHLRLVSLALQALFRTLGFSAKRTSGFGLAADEVEGAGGHGEGSLIVHAPELRESLPPAAPAPQEVGPPVRPAQIDEFLEDGQFPLLDKGQTDSRFGVKRRGRYKQARTAYLQWQEQMAAWTAPAAQAEPEPPALRPAPPLRVLRFQTFGQLVATATEAATVLEGAHD